MANKPKRSTIYFDIDVHKALQLKALETSQSISDLVNAAVRQSLSEDAEDFEAFDERGKEPVISYDEMVRKLRKDGRL